MNETPVARHSGENSPEHVAMKMTETILIYIENGAWNQISREDYLNTYTECLEAVRGLRKRAPRRVEAAEGNGTYEFGRPQY